MRRFAPMALCTCVVSILASPGFAQETIPLDKAVEKGKVELEITGLGGSTGDTILLNVRRKVPVVLRLSLAPGTVFKSVSGNVQNMVAAGIKGQRIDEKRYRPGGEIVLTDDAEREFIVEAYCLDFHKANPTAADAFSLSGIDREAAGIVTLGKDKNLRINAIQSALWMDRESVGESRLKQRFPVNDEDLAAARRLVESHREASKSEKDQPVSHATATQPAGLSVYHFRPGRSIPEGIHSRNVAVQDTNDGRQQITNLEDPRLAFFAGEYLPDALGSTDIHVRVDPQVGHTTLGGLEFQNDCVVNVWGDGVLEVDRVGVVATDKDGARFSSRSAMIGDRNAVVMVRDRSLSEKGGSADKLDSSQPELGSYFLPADEASSRKTSDTRCALESTPDGKYQKMSTSLGAGYVLQFTGGLYPDIDSPGAEITAIGEVKWCGYRFQSDADLPLVFKLVTNKGLAYLCGKGRVVFPSGEQRTFGANMVPDSCINALKSENELVREGAAQALGYLKARSAVPALIDALRDPSRAVQRNAIEALGKIGDERGLEALRDAQVDSGLTKVVEEARNRLENSGG